METKEDLEVTPTQETVVHNSYWKIQDNIERLDKLGQLMETNEEAVETMEVSVMGGLFRDLAHLMDEALGKLADKLLEKGINLEEDPEY